MGYSKKADAEKHAKALTAKTGRPYRVIIVPTSIGCPWGVTAD